MIKNFVFDMGRVLIYFDTIRIIERYDVTNDEKELLKKEVFDSKEWQRLDEGTLTEDEFHDILKTKLPAHLHDIAYKLIYYWDDPIEEVRGMYDLIKIIKEKGFNIYLLSNAAQRQHLYWPRIGASNFFDGKVISADVKVVKPNPRIYEILFNKFNIRPEESFFVDDVEANVQAARALGMQGYVFNDDAEQLRAYLEKHVFNQD